jgi:methylphosphotriester-DNA--protein-cysteine methyltransferase
MFSLFGSKHCKRCDGELAEVEKQLRELKAENQRLHQALEQAQQNSASQAGTLAVAIGPKITYIASWNRTHFHRPNCVWMEKLSEKNLREFSSHEEAVKAGYRPCKTCCA